MDGVMYEPTQGQVPLMTDEERSTLEVAGFPDRPLPKWDSESQTLTGTEGGG
jgi:hypothetical protein